MKRILVADDAAFMRKSIKNMLLSNGHKVVGEAENGKVALKKFEELSPDIITMDITMPEMDGLASLKAIMARDASANVVMISSMEQENLVNEAVLCGAKGFVVKPFKEDTFIAALEKFA